MTQLSHRRPTRHAGRAALGSWWSDARLPSRWTPFLLLVIAGLLVISFSQDALRLLVSPDIPGLDSLERWFDVDREMGVPAWFSTLLLFLCAQSLWRLADTTVQGPRHRWAIHERWLAAGFVYLSVDEATAIHEQTITPLREAFDLDGVLTFAWVLVAVPAVAVVGVLLLGYLRALPSRVRWLLLLSGAMYVGGAVGVELVGSTLYGSGQADSLLYAAITTVEEGLEMLAPVLLLGVLSQFRRSTRVRVD